MIHPCKHLTSSCPTAHLHCGPHPLIVLRHLAGQRGMQRLHARTRLIVRSLGVSHSLLVPTPSLLHQHSVGGFEVAKQLQEFQVCVGHCRAVLVSQPLAQGLSMQNNQVGSVVGE